MQTLNINQKIAKMPFILLYGILAFFIVFSFLCTYLFQKDWSAFQEGQPIDYALAGFFSNLLGIEFNEYFLLSIPIMLLIVFGAIKLGGWLIKHIDKKTEINGEKHVAMILILLLLPNFLYLIMWLLFGTRLMSRYVLIAGLALMIGYIIVTEIDDKAQKRKRGIKK